MTCALTLSRPRTVGRIILLTFLPAAFAFFAPAYAHPVTMEIHYTRFEGEPNINKVTVQFDGENLTIGKPESLASGVAAAPRALGIYVFFFSFFNFRFSF